MAAGTFEMMEIEGEVDMDNLPPAEEWHLFPDEISEGLAEGYTQKFTVWYRSCGDS